MENTYIMKFIINNLSYVVAVLGILMIAMYLLMINLFFNTIKYYKKIII